jgi:hypothetical protein
MRDGVQTAPTDRLALKRYVWPGDATGGSVTGVADGVESSSDLVSSSLSCACSSRALTRFPASATSGALNSNTIVA